MELDRGPVFGRLTCRTYYRENVMQKNRDVAEKQLWGFLEDVTAVERGEKQMQVLDNYCDEKQHGKVADGNTEP